MGWFSAFVLYAVIWFLTLFVVLPLRLTTQAEAGKVVPGTPRSAPANAMMKRRLVVTTVAGTVIWAVVAVTILSGWITIADLDRLYGR
jgi:predicted secreted protein